MKDELNTEPGFSRLYVRFQKPILHYVSRRISCPHAAEEITQEIFLKAFRFRDGYKSGFAFSTWLWSIARSSVIDWARSHGRDSSRRSQDTEWEEIACARPDAESILLERGEREHLQSRLGRLTELQRRVLSMRIVQQLSYKEISHSLGMSVSASKCLFYRAKQALLLEDGGTLAMSPA